jgi:hypothetical protein
MVQGGFIHSHQLGGGGGGGSGSNRCCGPHMLYLDGVYAEGNYGKSAFRW